MKLRPRVSLAQNKEERYGINGPKKNIDETHSFHRDDEFFNILRDSLWRNAAIAKSVQLHWSVIHPVSNSVDQSEADTVTTNISRCFYQTNKHLFNSFC